MNLALKHNTDTIKHEETSNKTEGKTQKWLKHTIHSLYYIVYKIKCAIS